MVPRLIIFKLTPKINKIAGKEIALTVILLNQPEVVSSCPGKAPQRKKSGAKIVRIINVAKRVNRLINIKTAIPNKISRIISSIMTITIIAKGPAIGITKLPIQASAAKMEFGTVDQKSLKGLAILSGISKY